MFTWGLGTDGQLGHKKFESKTGILGDNYYTQEEPRKLMKSKRFAQIAVGGTFTFALTRDGDLFGWGKDFLKFGDKVQSNEPVKIEIPEGKKIVSVSAGLKHYAAIDIDGQVYTWGEGGSWFSGGGQLGHGSRSNEPYPK